MVQPRYRAPAQMATCTPLPSAPGSPARVELLFDEPVRALALGQVAAFYEPDGGRGEKLLGGGFFESACG